MYCVTSLVPQFLVQEGHRMYLLECLVFPLIFYLFSLCPLITFTLDQSLRILWSIREVAFGSFIRADFYIFLTYQPLLVVTCKCCGCEASGIGRKRENISFPWKSKCWETYSRFLRYSCHWEQIRYGKRTHRHK